MKIACSMMVNGRVLIAKTEKGRQKDSLEKYSLVDAVASRHLFKRGVQMCIEIAFCRSGVTDACAIRLAMWDVAI